LAYRLLLKKWLDLPTERKNTMADMPKYTGLCETCEHDATCMLRRSSELAIIQCEEFSIMPVPSKPISSRKEVPVLMSDGSAELGLCANCLNILTCGFPNARQSVVQCEEYMLDEAGVIPPLQAEYSKSAA
jgi:hypothetical protein